MEEKPPVINILPVPVVELPVQETEGRVTYVVAVPKDDSSFNGSEFSISVGLADLEYKIKKGEVFTVSDKYDEGKEIILLGGGGGFCLPDETNFERVNIGDKYKVVEVVPNLSIRPYKYKVKFRRM